MSTRILIADTIGSRDHVCEAYRERFPWVTWLYMTHPACPDTKPHPHGGHCASIAVLPFADTRVECMLLRWIDARSENPENYILDVIRDYKPHVVSNSWGVTVERTSSVWRRMMEGFWREWVRREADLRADMRYAMVASAGNTDTHGTRFSDLCLPWSLMPTAIKVGSIDRTGVETEWSSDGSVDVVSVGNHRFACNPYTGDWDKVAGTSFSGPAVAGLIAREWDREVDPQYWIRSLATPIPGVSLPDPKVGYGEVEERIQQAIRRAGGFLAAGVPTGPTARTAKLRYIDSLEVPW